MNCFTSLGSVLFTFHVQGCPALIIVVVLLPLLFCWHHFSPSPKASQPLSHPASQAASRPGRERVARSCRHVEFYSVFGQLSLLFCSKCKCTHTHTNTHVARVLTNVLVISATSKIQFCSKLLLFSLKRSIANARQWPHLFINNVNLHSHWDAACLMIHSHYVGWLHLSPAAQILPINATELVVLQSGWINRIFCTQSTSNTLQTLQTQSGALNRRQLVRLFLSLTLNAFR